MNIIEIFKTSKLNKGKIEIKYNVFKLLFSDMEFRFCNFHSKKLDKF